MKFICLILLQVNLFVTEMDKLVNSFKSGTGREGISVSVSVRSLKTGAEIYDYQSGINLPPASTLKLITTGTALERFGSGHKIPTILYADGNIGNGVLDGNLIIEGRGDPTLGSEKFDKDPFKEILSVLKQNRIRTISGRIIIAGDAKPQFPISWLVTDIGNYYGAFPNKFNFHENYYTVYFNGADIVGDFAIISKVEPFDPSWKFYNEVGTGPANSGDQVNILNLPFSNDIQMVGTVPLKVRNFPVKGAMPSPNRIFIDSLSRFLDNNGIKIQFQNREKSENLKELGRIFSPDLFEIAKETNRISVNFFADGLANLVWQAEAEDYDAFLKDYWKTRGLDLSAHIFFDGSGLAPQNTFSSRSMTAFLAKMKNNRDFFLSIPVVGKEGTVANLGKNTRDRIRAKSGSIRGTWNHSGYVTGKDGEKYAFSIYCYGYTGKHRTAVRQLFNDFFTQTLKL